MCIRDRAKGVGHPVEGSNGAKLKVCFAPNWLRWLPLVWSDYWILHVDAGYRHALVGTPDRRYLWIPVSYTHLDVYKRQSFVPSRLRLRRLMHGS